ncbi:restriction endonuclease subunit S, partial [Bacillus cereus group sp. BceL238]
KTVSVSGYYNVFTNDSSYRNYFLANYLTSEKMIWRYKSIATGSLIEKQRVHYSQFIELQELLPSVEEAMQISNFLELLDKRIYRQQEKVHLLKEQKKGYMQKIFKQEIRFKDDDGGDYPEWEVYKLKDFVERVNRKNGENMTNHPLTISAQFGLVDQMEYFNKKVASESLTGYYLLRKGEFAYNKSYSKGYPYGAIKRLDRYEHGALSTLYICFSPNKNVLSDFLVQYFDSSAWYREVSMVSVEGARNHGLLNVSVTDFFETNHKLPSLEEQIKISNFLSELDDKLQLEQQKLEALQQQKKGFMQQMFI